MVEYAKPWLSIDAQIDKLESRGVDIGSRDAAEVLLKAIGYYRLTGYLYPFRYSTTHTDGDDKQRVRIMSQYTPGTSLAHAAKVVDFDRRLRLVVLDGVERIEIALRMQIGYTLGHRSPFAHLDPSSFVSSFTDLSIESPTGEPTSKHLEWQRRVNARRAGSDEAFVAHFRHKYDDQMPIWALTELLELGHLGRLYGGLTNSLATEIAQAYRVPTKRLMGSWIASLNYVRNVAAHHSRLYNRKLVAAPQRPTPTIVPLLDHLRAETTAKSAFGLYNALAVIAYLLRSIDPESGWPQRLRDVVMTFPTAPGFTDATMGVPADWVQLALWTETETATALTE